MQAPDGPKRGWLAVLDLNNAAYKKLRVLPTDKQDDSGLSQDSGDQMEQRLQHD